MVKNEKIMTAHWWVILKTVVRSSVDNYVLPGTATGTDILLIYMASWKRHFILISTATFYLAISQFDVPRMERILSENSREVEDAETCS